MKDPVLPGTAALAATRHLCENEALLLVKSCRKQSCEASKSLLENSSSLPSRASHGGG